MNRQPTKDRKEIHPMKTRFTLIGALTVIAVALLFGASLNAGEMRPPLHQIHTPDVVYVGTPYDVVSRMLKLAALKKDDVVYDLGCGDGRMVVLAAKKYGCRGTGYDIDPERVAAAFRELAGSYEFFVVEGVGGLYVPLIGTRFLVLDLITWLHLPLLVVARASLGTINHTALTVLAARRAGLPVAGVVLNRFPNHPSLAEETNPGLIEAITEVAVLGRVPEVADLDSPSGRQTFLSAMDQIARNLAQACAARAFLECMIEA
jgi:SAM-dependent methyltransferase